MMSILMGDFTPQNIYWDGKFFLLDWSNKSAVQKFAGFDNFIKEESYLLEQAISQLSFQNMVGLKRGKT